MSVLLPKNPYHDAGITWDEKDDIIGIEKHSLPYIYCCRNPEYGTVCFANLGDPTYWLDYMIIPPESNQFGMAEIFVGDFHDHPLCEGKSEEEILSLYRTLMDAYRKFAPHINKFWEMYGTRFGNMFSIYNGSYFHGLDLVFTYKDTETFKDHTRKIQIATSRMDICFMLRMREIKNDIMLILKKAMDNGWKPETIEV